VSQFAIRSARFDIEQRVRAGSARFIEALDEATTNEIVSRVLSVIDPEVA
jgi:mRNA interferase ChpB